MNIFNHLFFVCKIKLQNIGKYYKSEEKDDKQAKSVSSVIVQHVFLCQEVEEDFCFKCVGCYFTETLEESCQMVVNFSFIIYVSTKYMIDRRFCEYIVKMQQM